ncbi:MAG: glycoside hydrolase family 3 C-terminal domain-containing protein [Bacilli bacterium]|jgi:beta-glucosidase|nr:glycoside hydrolase family 3 C-terminal domain-containing protein [Bacilli bacterium]MCI2055394.1 glycoside hydrolase family 3 C-terminal domain-containing protein [Bacilli bacterium]
MQRKKQFVISTAFSVLIVGVAVTINALSLTYFDGLFTRYFGSTKSSLTTSDESLANLDTQYSKSEFGSREERKKSESDYVLETASEGITLLQNDGSLPLSKGTKISLFSHSSVDPIYTGTGSGSSSASKTTLKESIIDAGFTLNETLWDFYASGNGSSYVRSSGSSGYGANEEWYINECPLSVLLNENGLSQSWKDTTAVFVLSRTGGEGKDLPRRMRNWANSEEDKSKHYLEPDSTELGVISYLNDNFTNVILIVNSNNAMELGWVKNYPNVKSVLSAPALGESGAGAIGKIFSGEVNPGGHLADTYVYDDFSSPAMMNMGDYGYTKNGSDTSYRYVNYDEGIYVGYLYYETRYEDSVLGNDSSYDYDSEVVYPFGYGLSYTSFEWSDFSYRQDDDVFTFSVNVKNVGSVSGKDVVQLYSQSPYTDYDKANGVEKPAVKLSSFAKTSLLEPGESETITMEVDKKDLTSYDENKAKAYILDDGTYYFSLASNAHEAVNNILNEKQKDGVYVNADKKSGSSRNEMTASYTQESFDDVTYSTSSTGVEVTNQFDHAKKDGTVYLSRKNWESTFPKTEGTASTIVSNNASRSGYLYVQEIDDDTYSKLQSTDSLNPNDLSSLKDVTYGANNSSELIDVRGLDYDDEAWDDVLDNITKSEYENVIAQSGYGTKEMDSINKPKTVELDGPAGFNAVVGTTGNDSICSCSELVIAQSWNVNLAKRLGELVGEDGLAQGISGWYAPAMNIHRTPFGGRNYEYYSEDGYLSGEMGKSTIVGAASKGIYTTMKHFALNEQECNRGGVATWANEQSIREIYLKPFQKCVEETGEVSIKSYKATEVDGSLTYVETTSKIPACMGIMSSFNRIGYVWAGGDYPLLTTVLRNEWGFKGFVITDYDSGGYMDTIQMLKAGGDVKLNQLGSFKNFSNSATLRNLSRNSAHHLLYAIVNSSAMNGYINGTSYVSGFPYYYLILIAYDALSAGGIGLIYFFYLKGVKKEKKAKKAKQSE